MAWWYKNAITWFSGGNYGIFAEKDCDADLIVSFWLTYKIDQKILDQQAERVFELWEGLESKAFYIGLPERIAILKFQI